VDGRCSLNPCCFRCHFRSVFMKSLLVFVLIFLVMVSAAQGADQPMKICVISLVAGEDVLADAVLQELVVPENSKIETLLDSKKLRENLNEKAKELGYSHVLLVRVNHSARPFPGVRGTKIHKSVLN